MAEVTTQITHAVLHDIGHKVVRPVWANLKKKAPDKVDNQYHADIGHIDMGTLDTSCHIKEIVGNLGDG